MTTKDILEKLKYNDGVFPRDVLAEAVENRDEITPELLEIIEFATGNIESLNEEKDYFAHIYAMYLLAQFREKRAYKLLINFFSIPGRITLDFTGDVVTQDLGRILASVYDGDVSLLKKLIENEKADEYVRSAAMNTLSILVVTGEKTRDEIINYFKELFHGKLENKLSNVWNALVSESTELYPEEVFEDIERAFEEGLVEPFYTSLKNVEDTLKGGKEKCLNELKNNDSYSLIENTIREMEYWACFEQSPPKSKNKNSLNFPVISPVRNTEKIGRNDPCPCGSGKKYKKCCMGKV